MLSNDQVKLLEVLRDDCDALITTLVRNDDDELCVISVHTAERLVKLFRHPRLLFDMVEGWPALEDIAGAMSLSVPLMSKLASEVEGLCAWYNARVTGPPAPVKNSINRKLEKLVSPKEMTSSLRTGSAEVPLWKLRWWLDKRIVTIRNPQIKNSQITASAPMHLIKPPSLHLLGESPSLGSRPVGDDRIGVIKAVLLERANLAHEAVLQAIRGNLAAQGGKCFQSVLIDLACVLEGSLHLVEAKSISPDNEVEQVRSAFSQLHDYRFRYSKEEYFVGREIILWVALSSTPQTIWTVEFLRYECVFLVWLGQDGKLAGPDAHILESLTSRHTGTVCENLGCSENPTHKK